MQKVAKLDFESFNFHFPGAFFLHVSFVFYPSLLGNFDQKSKHDISLTKTPGGLDFNLFFVFKGKQDHPTEGG